MAARAGGAGVWLPALRVQGTALAWLPLACLRQRQRVTWRQDAGRACLPAFHPLSPLSKDLLAQKRVSRLSHTALLGT